MKKSYVIVGGSHGIGLGIVKRLHASDASVTIISRTVGGLADIDGVKHIPLDVVCDEIHAEHLPVSIDGFVYCPGSINLGPLRGLKPEAMLADYQLNVVGAVKGIQAAFAGLKAATSPSILMFSTIAVSQGMPMHASVAAVKGAIEGLTRSLAAELAPRIRVNCIAPSLTDTPLAERLLSTDQKRSMMADRHPLKRIGAIEDISAAAQFLLSDDAGWITGQVLGVDGGLSTLRL